MAANEPRTSATIVTDIRVGAATGSEIVGVKVGNLVGTLVYVFGAPGTAPAAAPRRPRDAVPYKSLRAYAVEDQDLFFGRTALIQQLNTIIRSNLTTALLGRAAIGKTSLIHAGLVPALASGGNTIAFTIRDYNTPVAGVRQALRQIPTLNVTLPADESLSAVLSALVQQTNQQIVIFFDQFERLFATPVAQQDEFARQVAAIQNQSHDQRLRLVLALREKYRAQAQALDARINDAHLLSNSQDVPGLSPDEAKEAIAEPLIVPGEISRAKLEDGLIEQWVVPQLIRISNATDGRIDPTPLQIICSQLYARALAQTKAGDQPLIQIKDFTDLKQADGILQSYLTNQKSVLGVGDDDWWAIGRALNELAKTDTLDFRTVTDLARAANKSEANVKNWLELLANQQLLEARADGSYALIGNYLVKEIRTLNPETYNQAAAEQALTRVVADWDDLALLTDQRRLKRLADARSLIHPSPKAYALLLRSAAAYEADPHFWLTQIIKDAPTQQAIARLAKTEAGVDGDVAEVLLGLKENGTAHTLAEAAVQSPIENVRIASALALSTLGVQQTLEALRPFYAATAPRSFGRRLRAIIALAWIRLLGLRGPWEEFSSPRLVSFIVPLLRLRANRVKIASVVASALVATVLLGIIQSAVNDLTAVIAGFPLGFIPKELILQLAVGVTSGGIIGVFYAIADVLAPPQRRGVTALLRVAAVVVGFAVANAFVIGAQIGFFPEPRALLIGALASLGFAAGNELALRRLARDDWQRLWFCALGLAASVGAATLVTLLASQASRLAFTSDDALPLRFGLGITPSILFFSPIPQIAYVALNAIAGGIIGLGLASGLAAGDWLSDQLERARYV